MDIGELLDKLYHDPDDAVEHHIPNLLAKLGSRKATIPLGMILIDDLQPDKLRIESAEALGKLGDPQGMKYLSSVLHQGAKRYINPDLLRDTIWAIGQVAMPQALELLKELMHPDILFKRLDEKCRKSIPKAIALIAEEHDETYLSLLLDLHDIIEIHHRVTKTENRVIDDIFRCMETLTPSGNIVQIELLRTISWDRFVNSPPRSNEALTSIRLFRTSTAEFLRKIDNKNDYQDEFERIINNLWNNFSEYRDFISCEIIDILLDISDWYPLKIYQVQNLMATIFHTMNISDIVLEKVASKGQLNFILQYMLHYGAGESITDQSYDHWIAIFHGLSTAFLHGKRIDFDCTPILKTFDELNSLPVELERSLLMFKSLYRGDFDIVLSKKHDPAYRYVILETMVEFPDHPEGLDFLDEVIHDEYQGIKHIVLPVMRKLLYTGSTDTIERVQSMLEYVYHDHGAWHIRRDARKLLDLLELSI